jgi:hypothetical protein
MEGPTVQVSAESVSLAFQGDDIEIFVQCTDTFCLIPVRISKVKSLIQLDR